MQASACKMINKLQRDGMCARMNQVYMSDPSLFTHQKTVISRTLHYSIKVKVVAIGTGSKHKEKFITSDI